LYIWKIKYILNINPTLSIIVPTHNNVENLQKCIESIGSQSFIDYEVWIVDGDSTDETKDYLHSLTPPFYWISEKDNGIYDAMNKGVNLSKGDWLYFLGADDIFMDNNTLASVFNQTYEKEDLLLGCIKYSYDETDSFIIKNRDGLVVSELSRKLWLKNVVHHQAMFYKRTVFDRHKYPLDYNILADYALNLKLFKEKVIAKKIDVVIALCGSQGVSKNYNWSLYCEEIKLKTAVTSKWHQPLFFIIASFKYLIKKF